MIHVIKTRTCKEGVWCSYNGIMGLMAPTPTKGVWAIEKEIVDVVQSGDEIKVISMDPITRN